MGTWGTGLYQDDIALDIKETYRKSLEKGFSGNEITQAMLNYYSDVIEDEEDGPVFWFALADTQWNLGRLEDMVKDKALYYLNEGSNLRRWQDEDPKSAKKREKVLMALKEKLVSEQPAEKKIRVTKLYRCEWQMGDVYAYPLDSDYAKEKGISGRYFLFYKIGETTWDKGHVIPVVWVKITEDGNLPQNVDDFNALKYVQTGVTRYEHRFFPFDARRSREEQIAEKMKANTFEVDEYGLLPRFRLNLINTSKRIIPKKLVYVGNFQGVNPPEKEFNPPGQTNQGFAWKFFDKSMIDLYFAHTLRQSAIYTSSNR